MSLPYTGSLPAVSCQLMKKPSRRAKSLRGRYVNPKALHWRLLLGFYHTLMQKKTFPRVMPKAGFLESLFSSDVKLVTVLYWVCDMLPLSPVLS